MTEQIKKILIAEELISSPTGIFFISCGLECASQYKEAEKEEYAFIVDDFLPEITKIPRVKLDPRKVYEARVENSFRAVFDSNYLVDSQIQKLISLHFSKKSDLDLFDEYPGKFKTLNTIKLQEYLNVGFFIDTIVIDAYKNQFNYDLVRKYLNHVVEYSFKQVEERNSNASIDVLYSVSEDIFMIEFSFHRESFTFSRSIFDEMNLPVNYFSVNYFTKRNKISLTAMIFSSEKLKSFKSFFFTETSLKKKTQAPNAVMELGLEKNENIQYMPRDFRLEDEQAKKLSQARKFSLFIKNYRKGEVNPKEIMSLDLIDVEKYLNLYPKPEAVANLDMEAKSFILKLLQDKKLFDGIVDYMQKVANSDLEPQSEQIQRVLASKTLEDLEEMIRIKGVTENKNMETIRVAGWLENKEENSTGISQFTETINNEEIWAVKRSEISIKIQDEVIRLKASGKKVLKEDILRIVSQEVDIGDENIGVVVNDIVEEAIASELTQKSNLQDAFALKFLSQQNETKNLEAKKEFDDQLIRMKKAMSQMKSEMTKLRKDNEKIKNTAPPVVENLAPIVQELKNALGKAMVVNSNKEKIIAKMKEDFERKLNTNTEKMTLLENRIEELKEESTKNSAFVGEEKLIQLTAENKSLINRLELANLKVNTIHENRDKHDSEEESKREREIVLLKNNMQLAQRLIEKLKTEKIELESKLSIEKQKPSKIKEEKAPPVRSNDEEKEAQIMALVLEKRAMEEKFKVQTIELKKSEHKLKYALAQLEESQRKKAAPTTSSPLKSNESYIRQLENANSRILEASNDIAEKKKENIKLKQENALLTSKVSELEKKIAYMEKKAA